MCHRHIRALKIGRLRHTLLSFSLIMSVVLRFSELTLRYYGSGGGSIILLRAGNTVEI